MFVKGELVSWKDGQENSNYAEHFMSLLLFFVASVPQISFDTVD